MPLKEYQALIAKVDAESQALFAASAEQIVCTAGCASCCADDLSVLLVEAFAIQEYIEQQRQRQPNFQIHSHPKGACVFLDGHKRCQIYPVRPILCRTHGLALKIPDLKTAKEAESKPAIIQLHTSAKESLKQTEEDVYYCELNFVNQNPKAEQILDTSLLQILLSLVHQRFKENSLDPDEDQKDRIQLRDLLI